MYNVFSMPINLTHGSPQITLTRVLPARETTAGLKNQNSEPPPQTSMKGMGPKAMLAVKD